MGHITTSPAPGDREPTLGMPSDRTSRTLAAFGALVCLLACTLPALAHIVTYGFTTGSNPGAYTFWYGTYHAPPNAAEGQVQITGCGPTQTANFTTTATTQPSGLVKGTNYFFATNYDGTAAAGAQNGPVQTWQGAPLTSLTTPGTCTVTYIPPPLASQNWDPTGGVGGANGTKTGPVGTITITLTAALTITKTSSATTYSTVGAVIPYSYVIKNTGNMALTAPMQVSDNKTTVSCPAYGALPGSSPAVNGLAPGASMTCTANYTVTQADIDAGSLTNTATATSGTATATTAATNTTALTIPATQNKSLSVAKASTTANFSGTGVSIPYTYVVKNTGNTTLTSLTLADSKIATVSCPVTTLAPGAQTTCTANYTTTQADIDAGGVTNTATATGTASSGTTTSPAASKTVPSIQTLGITIAKATTTATFNAPGVSIPYTYLVKNTGNTTLATVKVSDNRIATVTCPATTLAPGAQTTCTASYTTTQADVDAGGVTNTASASGVALSGTATSTNASVTVPAVQTPGMTVAKTSTTSNFNAPGVTITYSYAVKNTGNTTITSAITVSDSKIASVSCPALPVGGLAPNATLTCSASTTTTQADVDLGSLTNTASSKAGALTSPTTSLTIPATRSPALTVVKGTTATTYSVVGAIIPYTYLVKNTGNVTITSAISVSDNKIPSVSCPALPVGGLAPAASLTCAANYTITQADIDTGKVVNTASATSGTITSSTVTLTLNATQTPGMAVTKTSTTASFNAPGVSIPYSYTVKNTGNTTITTAITVSDNKIAAVTCPALPVGGLAPNASINCTGSYTTTQADVDAGGVTNTASSTSGSQTSPVTSLTVPATQTRSLSLSKVPSPTTYSTVGTTITYTYTAKNTGNITIPPSASISVSDNKIASVTCPAMPAGGLAPNATLVCTATYAIKQSDIDAGSITNIASATDGVVTSQSTTATVNAVQTSAMTIVKTASVSSFSAAGVSITYSYKITNSGNTTLTSAITVSDNKISSVSCPALPAGGLVPGAFITCTATYITTQADVDGGGITNTASAKSGSLTSPSTSLTVASNKTLALSLQKSTTASPFGSVGTSITYSYKVTNSGNTTLTSAVTVSDNKIASVTCPALPAGGLAPGAFITCSATYSTTQADLDLGSVTNLATASSGAVTSSGSSVTVAAAQAPALTVAKTSTSSSFNAAGAILAYSYKVTNSGNVTLTSAVTVSDNKIASVSCPALPVGGLAPTAFITCTANYTITQADIDAGGVTNTASGKSGSTTSNLVSLTVPASQAPAMTVAKTSTSASYSTLGQVIPYSYKVTNSGNTTLTSAITVTDSKIASVSCPALPVGGLAPNAFITCSASYTVTQADLDSGSLTNSASSKSGSTTSPTISLTLNAAQSQKLSVVKNTAATTYSTVGAVVPYTYVVTNSGNTTINTAITVSDNKIPTVTCPALPGGKLAPGTSITCTANYTVTQGDLDGGNILNVASAVSGSITSSTTSFDLTGTLTPQLTITKTSTTTSIAAAGQVVTYTYTAKNTGNVTLTKAITVSDNKVAPANLSCAALPAGGLPPAASLTCTGTYTVTQPDMDAGGNLTNTATATSGTTATPTVTSNTVLLAIPVSQSPRLSVVKNSTAAPFTAAGQTLNYTYTVKNTGNVSFTSAVSVNDNKIASVSCPAMPVGGLAPNASLVCTASYTTTQADVDAGSVTNTASAQSGSTVSTPPVSFTVSATQTHTLSLTKAASIATYSSTGTTVTYTYTVTNTGNTSITSPITVADNKITVSCPALPAGGIAPNGKHICSAIYTTKQSDIDAGSITNTATATDGVATSASASVTVTAQQLPAMTVVKATTTTSFNAVGQSIPYTFKVTNTGNTTLTSAITVSDSKISSVSCPTLPAGGLVPTASITCAGNYTTTQADLDAGSIVNTASSKSGTTTSPGTSHTLNASVSRALTLTKSGAPATYNGPGTIITYTYIVKNSGNATIPQTATISVSDNKIASVSCPAIPAAGIAPQATLTCTATYTTTQADVDAGQIVNVATATDGTVTSPSTTATVKANQTSSLSLVKATTAASFSNVGQVIPYTYTVTNSGNTTVTQVMKIADNKIASVSCPVLPAGGLAPQATLVCTANYTITQADLDAGTVTNVASAQSGTVTSPTQTVTLNAVQTRALSIAKSSTATTFSSVGQTIPYSYVVTNTGNVTLTTSVIVTDSKIATVNCPALPAGGLAPGASLTCSANYAVKQADLDLGSVTNAASAASGSTVSTSTSLKINATQTPALSISKTSPVTSFSTAGTSIAYSYKVTNSGNVTFSSGVTVTDSKIATVSCPALPGGGLAPGAFITCSANYTTTQADVDFGSVTNSATAQSGASSSSSTSLTINATLAPGMTVVKSSTVANFNAAGVSIPYKYVVTNSGNTTLTSALTISDNKIAAVSCPALPVGGLLPGQSLTCTAAYTTTQADVDAGGVTNSASSKSGTAVSPTVSYTVPSVQSPALAVVKTTTATTFSAPGTVIPYSYKVTNSGNTTLTAAITVSDNRIASVSCPALPAGGLAPNAFMTCNANYTTTQADVDGGSVSNTASAKSGATVSQPVTITVTATQTPDMTVVKTSPTSRFSAAGTIISYSYKVTNSGNVTLTNAISISDNKIVTVSCPALPASGLAPGAFVTCNATYTTTQADVDAGGVTNSASSKSGSTTSLVTSLTIPATQTPTITVLKTSTTISFNAAGDIVPYSYKVTNTGNVTMTTAVTVSDNKIATVTCPALSAAGLAPGAFITCTASYTVTQADVDAGGVTNTALAKSGTGGSNTTTSSAVSLMVPSNKTPAMTVVKTSTTTKFTAPGVVIPYSYQVTNTGNTTFSSAISITDNKIPSVTCPALPAGGLLPGASITCSASYTTTQADVDAGGVTNTASSKSGTTTSPTTTLTVPATQTPGMTVVKSTTAATYTKPGAVIPYSYAVTNTGNTTLTSVVTIADDKIASVSCPALPAGGLAPAASIVCTGNYTVTQSDLNTGSVTNNAFSKSGTVLSQSVAVTVTATQTFAMTVLKTSTTSNFTTAGVTIPYSYKVTNTGNVTLTSTISVMDSKIPAVPCPSLPAGGLAPGAFITCTASYTTTQADVDAGGVTNTASAKSGTTISPTVNLTVSATQTPSVTVVKSSSATSFSNPGEIIPYTYKVTNTGNVTMNNAVTINDNKIASVSCPALPAAGLAPAAFITCTANYTTTQADVDAGGVTNTAAAKSGATASSPTTSATVSYTVPANRILAMTVAKTSTTANFNAPGTLITYSYKVTNSGNTTFTSPITVSDNKIAAVSCPALPINGLAPLQFIVCSASYTTTQADMDAGGVTNTAVSKSGAVTSPAAVLTIPATQSPALTILKSTNVTTYATVGAVIPYTYTVTNSGNVSFITGITVSDDKIATVACPALPGGKLAPNASITCTGSYQVKQADLDAGTLTNTASAKSGTTVSPTVSLKLTATQQPALSIAKTSTTTSFASSGTAIPYSYKVTNTGNVTLSTSVTVTDDKIATVSCPGLPAGGLAPGASITCSGSYITTQADLDFGSIANTASATSGAVTSPKIVLTIPALKLPALGILKSSTTATFNAPGQTLSYTYVVTNVGNVKITNAITVSDNKIALVTCPALPAGGLIVGASITCTAPYTTTQADIDAGGVTNSAFAQSGTTKSLTTTYSVPATLLPAMSIDKKSTTTSFNVAGAAIPYTYTITNTGNVSLTGAITVADDKIPSVSCPPLPTGGLKPTATLTCTGTYIATQADIDAGGVTNKASSKNGSTLSQPVTLTIPSIKLPAISLIKTSALKTYSMVGSVISYSYKVINSGNTTITTPITVTDNLIATVPCPALPVNGLVPNAFITCSGNYTVTQADIDTGSITNLASAQSGTIKTAQVSLTIKATQLPGLVEIKTSTVASFDAPGVIIPYSYKITNSGNTTLTSPISVSDDKIPTVSCPAMPVGGLVPGASITCTGSYTSTQADLDIGAITNIAVAKSGSVTAKTSLTIKAIQRPNFTITKATTTPIATNNGDGTFTATFQIAAQNTGNVNLTSIQLADDFGSGLPQGAIAVSGTVVSLTSSTRGALPTANAAYDAKASNPNLILLEGEKLGLKEVITASVAITFDPGMNQPSDAFSNTVIGRARLLNASATLFEQSKTAFAPTAFVPMLPLVVKKTSSMPEVTVGGLVPYTVTVTNNDPQPRGNVTIIDLIPAGFSYRTGSATIDGLKREPVAAGRQLSWPHVTVAPKQTVTLKIMLIAGAGVGNGQYTNQAWANDGHGGATVSNVSSAVVRIATDPTFDCTDIIGKVFDDANGNGTQDAGERGLANVRLATVNGHIITTDQEGRYHIACAAIPDDQRGSNFILKLDERSLPSGYRLTVENPQAIRLTRGKLAKINFGAALGRVVRIDLIDDAYETGSPKLRNEWLTEVHRIMPALRSTQTVLRIGYRREPIEDKTLVQRRIHDLEALVQALWKQQGEKRRLAVESEIYAAIPRRN